MTRQQATRRATHEGAEHRGDAGPIVDRSSTPRPTASPRERPSGDEAMSRRGSSARRRPLRTALRVLVAALAVLLVGAVIGPYVYIHFIAGQPPKKLSFETTNSRAATGSGSAAKPIAPLSVAGAWKVSEPSTVGYRVPETIMGQGTTAVGRTAAVTGNLSITATAVRSADFTVDVTNIASDAPQRDADYRRIMETATFPTATFTLTTPIALTTIPADLQQITVPVTGNLTLHGVTKPVILTLKARRNGATIEVNGSIPITFSNYEIANPSIAGAITVGNDGELEFLLVFTRP
jgi:polyisoprenoid-binding protein YceI